MYAGSGNRTQDLPHESRLLVSLRYHGYDKLSQVKYWSTGFMTSLFYLPTLLLCNQFVRRAVLIIIPDELESSPLATCIIMTKPEPVCANHFDALFIFFFKSTNACSKILIKEQ